MSKCGTGVGPRVWLWLIAVLVFSGSLEARAWDTVEGRLDANLRLRAKGRLGRGMAACFVKSSDPDQTARRVRALGGSVGTVAGEILTVRLPADRLDELAGGTEVFRLEGGRPVRPRMDEVLTATGAEAAQAGSAPLTAPISGVGVLVGVVDYGIDLGHHAFLEGSHTAVMALWDQDNDKGSPPAGYSYGTQCDSEAIDQGLCSHYSDDDHGTHVTAIAAGRPVSGLPYRGMAPDAKIAFVNLGWAPDIDDEDAALTTAVCDGVAWIFGQAEAAGMPAVVNLSIGTHEGPHDGLSLASQCLDNLAGPGRIIVAAAGNEGAGGYHWVADEVVYLHAAGEATAAAQTLAFRPSWDDYPDETPYAYGYLWFDGPTNLSVRIGVQQQDGAIAYGNWTDWSEGFEGKLTTDDGKLGTVWLEGSESESGSRAVTFIVADDNLDDREREAVWLLEITGDGHFDGFIDTTYGGGFVPAGTSEAAVDNAMSIGYPAVAASVIAVGSYIVRNQWTDAKNKPHVQEDWWTGEPVVVGALSDYSSRGPSRNAAHTGVKPTLVAPGETIISALNADAWYQGLSDYVVVGAPGEQDGYLVMEGTSMASPVVTGAVALLLQMDSSLNPPAVVELLTSSAAVDEFVGGGEQTDWGAGKLDVWHALVALAEGAQTVTEGDDGVSVADVSTSDLDPGENKADGVTTAPAEDGREQEPGSSGGCSLTPDEAGGPSILLLLLVLLAALAHRRLSRPTGEPR